MHFAAQTAGAGSGAELAGDDVKTGHARPITGPMPRHQASLFGVAAHACSSHKTRAPPAADSGFADRPATREDQTRPAPDRRPAPRSADKVAPDSWRRGSGPALNAGLNVGIGIVDHQRLPHADRVVAFIEGEKPVDGPPGTVIQVAHRPMLVQFVDALRPAVGREPAGEARTIQR